MGSNLGIGYMEKGELALPWNKKHFFVMPSNKGYGVWCGTVISKKMAVGSLILEAYSFPLFYQVAK